jgi:hypothetical protein
MTIHQTGTLATAMIVLSIDWPSRAPVKEASSVCAIMVARRSVYKTQSPIAMPTPFVVIFGLGMDTSADRFVKASSGSFREDDGTLIISTEKFGEGTQEKGKDTYPTHSHVQTAQAQWHSYER